jgi:ATP-binding cassette subfamily B protein
MPPEHVTADDHAPTRDLPLAALWRTRRYLRPYLGRLIFMLAAACASVGAEIVIPLLTKSIIDGAITHGNRELLLLLGLAAAALGVAEAVLNLLRRWVQARAVTGMEMAMRDDLYAHLQRLDAGSTTGGSPASCCPGRPRTCRRSGGSRDSASSSSSPT